jgi:hypothetical protein
MPSSLNDACRRLELAADEIDRLRAQVEEMRGIERTRAGVIDWHMEVERLNRHNNELRAQVEIVKDGDEYTVDHYKEFWKAYDETPEGEGKWHAWVAALTAMMAVPFTSEKS